jgi:hypothetical protein
VQREHLVVGVCRHEIAGGGHELEADADRHQTADEEEDGDRDEVQQRNPLVIACQQP